MRYRAWVARYGFWRSYTIAAVLAPTGFAVLGAFVLGLVAAALGTHLNLPRLLLVGIALWTFILISLRVTSIVRALTAACNSTVVAVGGYGVALGLAIWNGLARGLLPLRWLGHAVAGTGWQAVEYTAALLILLLALGAVDGWLARRQFLAGRLGHRSEKLGRALLASGTGPFQALRRATFLGWIRHPVVPAMTLFGALWWPVALTLMDATGIEPGMLIAFCAIGPLLWLCFLRGNLLGIDGPGAWRYFGAGISPWDVLLQRGRMVTVLQVAGMVPVFILSIAWRMRPWGWTGFAAPLAFVVATVALQDAAGMLLSAAYPEVVVRSEYYSGSDATGGRWLAAGTLVWGSVFLILFLISRSATATRYWLSTVALLCLAIRYAVVHMRRDAFETWSDRILTRLGAV